MNIQSVDNATLNILRKVANTHNEYFLYRAETGRYEVLSILDNFPTFIKARELGRLKRVGGLQSMTEKMNKLNEDSELLVCYIQDGKVKMNFFSTTYEVYKKRNSIVEIYYGTYDEIIEFLMSNNLKIN